MPLTMDVEGMDDVFNMLESMGDAAEPIAKEALYVGAGLMAGRMKNEAGAIRTAPFKWAGPGEYRLPSPEEKEILMGEGAMGIARFKSENGSVTTSVGYSNTGYVNVPWRFKSSNARTNYRFKNGKTILARLAGRGGRNLKPIAVIANAINSGTSFMRKQPFVRKALKNGQTGAKTAMRTIIEGRYEEFNNK